VISRWIADLDEIFAFGGVRQAVPEAVDRARYVETNAGFRRQS
jgi:hypothetical protein